MRLATLWQNKLSSLLRLIKGNKSFFPADIYSETAYHNFIHRESKRSERSGHLCRILLVYRTNAQGSVVPFGAELADKAMSVLFSSCRDTDYIGWYRQGLIMGVLVTAIGRDSAREGCDNLKTRLVGKLRGAFTLTNDHPFQIRVLEQSELNAINASDDPVPLFGSID